MSQDRTLTPGARLAGVTALAALVALDLAWIVRDFGQAAAVTDAWWMWSGLIFRAQDGIWATSFVEPTLLVLCTVCAATAAVSSAASGILASAGTLTILLRVPTLWNLNDGWVRGGVSDALRLQALVSAIAMLVLGTALIVLAVVGRRAVPPGSGSTTRSARDEPPARPTPARGRAAGLLLAVVAAVLVSWEIHAATRQGWGPYSRHFTGDRSLATLLAVPESWYGCALALISLSAAYAALTRARCSRPLGMTVSGPLLGLGLFRLSFAAKSGLLTGIGTLPLRDQLWLATAVFEILAALGLLFALAPRDGDSTGRGTQPGTIRAFSSA